MAMKLLLLLAPLLVAWVGDTQRTGMTLEFEDEHLDENGCGWFCKDWCSPGVAVCHRLRCDPANLRDCPGTECQNECGGHTVMIGPKEEPDQFKMLWLPILGGSIALVCCITTAIFKYRSHQKRKRRRAQLEADRLEYESRLRIEAGKLERLGDGLDGPRTDHNQCIDLSAGPGAHRNTKHVSDRAYLAVKAVGGSPEGSPLGSPKGSALVSPKGSPKGRARRRDHCESEHSHFFHKEADHSNHFSHLKKGHTHGRLEENPEQSRRSPRCRLEHDHMPPAPYASRARRVSETMVSCKSDHANVVHQEEDHSHHFDHVKKHHKHGRHRKQDATDEERTQAATVLQAHHRGRSDRKKHHGERKRRKSEDHGRPRGRSEDSDQSPKGRERRISEDRGRPRGKSEDDQSPKERGSPGGSPRRGRRKSPDHGSH